MTVWLSRLAGPEMSDVGMRQICSRRFIYCCTMMFVVIDVVHRCGCGEMELEKRNFFCPQVLSNRLTQKSIKKTITHKTYSTGLV